MNFLSHFAIQAKPNNNSYSVGVSLPDIVSLYKNPQPLSQPLINNLMLKNKFSDECTGLACGMMAHYTADKIFHSSPWFNKTMKIASELYTQTFNRHLPHSLNHIVVEIILDHTLISANPAIIDQFYSGYAGFNSKIADEIFKHCTNYDNHLFKQTIERFLSLRYINSYSSFKGIATTLGQVAQRLNIQSSVNFSDLETYIQTLSEALEPQNRLFFEETHEKLFPRI
ncbi:MAG: ACP phosphodiesterase [Spirochaetes bacterium]|jgi:hypothetical protein|nr:ACP phosphodiesterase [Spirochaetota bacterium]